jgi:DNA-binding PadR family transcriptional regulator
MSTAELTTTSYAILGLLGIKPWTTYELAQQMERSLKSFWPRAQSRIYEEPKRLAALGLVKADAEAVGRRPRTMYSITPKGRRALARWIAEPGAGPVLEFEAMTKVFFAEHGRKSDVVANIEAIRTWAEEQTIRNVSFARMYVATGGPFPDRLPQIVLTGKFLTDLADMIEQWAAWAARTVAGWPDDLNGTDPDIDTLRSIAARPVSTPPLSPAGVHDRSAVG